MANNKKVKQWQDAWDVQHRYGEHPRGFIQWKGTDVCADLHCKCGEHWHLDIDFMYRVTCPNCYTKYYCNPHIELIEYEEEGV